MPIEKYLNVPFIVIILLLQYGSDVQAQVGFPSGTTVSCYGNDSSCSGTPTDFPINYGPDGSFDNQNNARFNPCCIDFALVDPIIASSYYTVPGSRCQSCGEQNVDIRGTTSIFCYTDAECSTSPGSSSGNLIYNDCCGNSFSRSAFITQQPILGECTPCTELADIPTGGADPHFVCPLKNGHSLCFSVQGIPEFIFNLFTDKYLHLNGKFALPQDEESRLLTDGSTFVQQLGLTVKHTATLTKVKISALDHSIVTADNFIIVEDYPITITITNNTVTTAVSTVSVNPDRDETAWVSIITDVGFSLKIKFVKKHIDYVITDSSGLTKEAHGIQGQFMGPKVQIDEDAGLMKIGDQRAPFAVKEGEIWPYLRMPGTCWYSTNTDDQGKGVIEGVYTDYIVDEIFGVNFMFNQFN